MSEPATDEGLTRTAQRHLTSGAYNGKRRRAGEPDHVSGIYGLLKKWAPVVAAIPTIGGAIFAVTNIWFQSDAEAQEAQAAILEDQRALSREIGKERERNDKQDGILNQINGKLDRGEILALKAERRGLRAEIESTGNNLAVRRRLERQLEAVEEDLRIRGVQ
jgi:hypothetical protein